MKQKWLIRILLILLEAVLLLSLFGTLITSPDAWPALLVFGLTAALIGYCLYRSFTLPRPSRALLLRVERGYASYLFGVFEDAPQNRRALLCALAANTLGARPSAVQKKLGRLLPLAKSQREEGILSFFLARTATLDGDPAAGEEYYLRAIACDPTIASAHANLSVIYQNKKDYTRAEEYALAAIALDGESAVKHTNLASLYILMHRTDDARREAKLALSKSDKATDAYVVLALAAAIDKNKAEANRYARKCIELGMEEAFIQHTVSALLRGDMSVLAPAEKPLAPAKPTHKSKTRSS